MRVIDRGLIIAPCADRSGYVTLEEFIAGFDAYSNATKPRDPLALVKCWTQIDFPVCDLGERYGNQSLYVRTAGSSWRPQLNKAVYMATEGPPEQHGWPAYRWIPKEGTSPAAGGVVIPKTEERGITIRQLIPVWEAIKAMAPSWKTEPGARFAFSGLAKDANLHHVCANIIKPASAHRECSFVEAIAIDPTAQRHNWFVSHSWLEEVCHFISCLVSHAFTRVKAWNSAKTRIFDSPYWVCAYAK